MVKNIPKVSRMSRCLGTVAVLVLCVTLADAAAGVGSVVVNRQRDMKEIAVAAKTIAAMFKAPDTYSSATFGEAARTVSERAGVNGGVKAGHVAEQKSATMAPA